MRIHTGVGHTDESAQHFWFCKTHRSFVVLLPRVWTSGIWILSPMLYQLSHPVTPNVSLCVSKECCESENDAKRRFQFIDQWAQIGVTNDPIIYIMIDLMSCTIKFKVHVTVCVCEREWERQQAWGIADVCIICMGCDVVLSFVHVNIYITFSFIWCTHVMYQIVYSFLHHGLRRNLLCTRRRWKTSFSGWRTEPSVSPRFVSPF